MVVRLQIKYQSMKSFLKEAMEENIRSSAAGNLKKLMQSEEDFIEEEISQQSSKPGSKASKPPSNHEEEVDERANLDPSHPERIIMDLEEQLKKWTTKFPINKISINSANSFKHLVYKAEEKGEMDKINKNHLYQKFAKSHKQMNMAHQMIQTKIIEEYVNLEELHEREAEMEFESDEDSSIDSESIGNAAEGEGDKMVSPPTDAVPAATTEPEKPEATIIESLPVQPANTANPVTAAAPVEETKAAEVPAPVGGAGVAAALLSMVTTETKPQLQHLATQETIPIPNVDMQKVAQNTQNENEIKTPVAAEKPKQSEVPLIKQSVTVRPGLKRGNTNVTSAFGTSRMGGSKGPSSSFGAGGGGGGIGMGGGGGGKVLEKRLGVFKKELEKFIKVTNKTQDETISKHQRRIIREMITSQNSATEQRVTKLEQALKETQTKVDSNQQMFKLLDATQKQMLKEFVTVKTKFAESIDMVEVNLKRTYRDKNEYKAMYSSLDSTVQFNCSRLSTAINFLSSMTEKVNSLTEIQKIGMAMGLQDERDKKFTQLYAIAQAEGKRPTDLDAPQSPIQVEKSCKGCSGNANFINKAFKAACLTYNANKVPFKDDLYDREELMNRQNQLMMFSNQPLDITNLVNLEFSSQKLTNNAYINDSRETLGLEDRRSESPYPETPLMPLNQMPHSPVSTDEKGNLIAIRDQRPQTAKAPGTVRVDQAGSRNISAVQTKVALRQGGTVMKKHLPSRNTTGFGTVTTNNSSMRSKVMARSGAPATDAARPASQAIDSECYRLRTLQGGQGMNTLNNVPTSSSNLNGEILPQNLGRGPDLRLNVQSTEAIGIEAGKQGYHTAKNNRRGKTALHRAANSFGGTPGGQQSNMNFSHFNNLGVPGANAGSASSSRKGSTILQNRNQARALYQTSIKATI